MGGPNPRKSPERKESLSEKPGYDSALQLIEIIKLSLAWDVDSKDIVNAKNPRIEELLFFSDQFAKEDPKKGATLDHITDVKFDEESQSLVLEYENRDFNIQIPKGDPIHEAIFWRQRSAEEIKAERDEVKAGAAAKRSAGLKALTGIEDLTTKPKEIKEKKEIPKRENGPESTVFLGDSIAVGLNDSLGMKQGKSFAKGGKSAKTMAENFEYFVENNQEDIAAGKYKQVFVLAGINDISNLEGYPKMSEKQKVNEIFKRLARIYKLAKKQKPPIKVIACTLPQANFEGVVSSYKKSAYWQRSEKGYPGDPARMQRIYEAVNKKIRDYPGITVVDLAEETKDQKKYPRTDSVHYSKEASKRMSEFIQKEANLALPYSAEKLSEFGVSIAQELTDVDIAAQSELVEKESKERAIGEYYDEAIPSEEIAKHLKEDRIKLGKSSVRDVRFNPRLLVPKEGEEENNKRVANIKAETARRIAAYSIEAANGWHTLDYSGVGGADHLYGVGLGDILLDPDIQEILVEKNGRIIKGTRGVTSGGRQAFLDENGGYIATFDGDKFMITSHRKLEEKEFIQKLDGENESRKVQKENYTEFEAIGKDGKITELHNLPYVKMKEELSVVDQIKFNLSGTQRRNAEIIEEEFTKAGLSKNIIAAAILNAHSESGLKADRQSGCPPSKRNPHLAYRGREDSWGLFQINVGAKTRKIKPESKRQQVAARLRKKFQDPRENCREIIKWIKGHRGRNLIPADAGGASVATLTAIFTADVEICHNRYIVGRKRGMKAAKWFETSERPPELQAKIDASKETAGIIKTEDSIRFLKKGKTTRGTEFNKQVIDINKGDEKLVFGSSTAVGQYDKNPKTGVYGFNGFDSRNFLDQFKRDVWSHMEQNPHLKPKKIVVVGLAVNGITKGMSVDGILSRYRELVNFFEKQGIEVHVATIQPGKPKNRRKIKAFNDAVRKEFRYQKVDLAAKVTDSQGGWKKGTTSDRTHAKSHIVSSMIATV